MLTVQFLHHKHLSLLFMSMGLILHRQTHTTTSTHTHPYLLTPCCRIPCSIHLADCCTALMCFSILSNSDDNMLKNVELFDKLSLRFHSRVLFLKDVISNNEICCWSFYGHGAKIAEVCCTSIVYGTDKKHTKVGHCRCDRHFLWWLHSLLSTFNHIGGEWGQHSHWMLVWVSSIRYRDIPRVTQILGPTLTSMWYPLNTNQKERATTSTWLSIVRLNPGGLGSLALVG